MGSEFVHLRENEVEYFECVDKGKDGKRWKSISHGLIEMTNEIQLQYYRA
jgi:hypothetical protein